MSGSHDTAAPLCTAHTFAGELLVLLSKFTVLHLLPVFQSAHLYLQVLKFVCLRMCRVYMVFIYLFGHVEARGGCWVSCSIPSPLSPLRQGLKGFAILVFFSMMVWACRHFCLLVLLGDNSLMWGWGDGSVARCSPCKSVDLKSLPRTHVRIHLCHTYLCSLSPPLARWRAETSFAWKADGPARLKYTVEEQETLPQWGRWKLISKSCPLDEVWVACTHT